jgi:hypothetical protein
VVLVVETANWSKAERERLVLRKIMRRPLKAVIGFLAPLGVDPEADPGALGCVVCGGVRYTLLAGGVLDSHRPKSSIRHGAAGDDDEEEQ